MGVIALKDWDEVMLSVFMSNGGEEILEGGGPVLGLSGSYDDVLEGILVRFELNIPFP